jgi:hypothetical protein
MTDDIRLEISPAVAAASVALIAFTPVGVAARAADGRTATRAQR